MNLIHKIYPLIAVVFLFSCNNEETINRPLAAIGDQTLWTEQVLQILPKDLNTEDSIQFVEHYIRTWIVDELMFQHAKKNIQNTQEIEQKAEEYKRSLILHTYLNNLAAQKVDQHITESEVKAYYDENDAGLRLNESIIKGFILKVPQNATELNKLKGWSRLEAKEAVPTTEFIDNIEKYCVQNAAIYEYFYDRWEPLGKLVEILPFQIPENERDFLQKTSFVELEDSSFYYFLNIKEYLSISDKQPYEFARKTIQDILLNKKRVDFIKSVEKDLYQEAIEQDKIKLYY